MTSNSFLEVKRDYDAKKGVFEMVCAQFSAKRKYLNDEILNEMIDSVDIIIDNTRYIVKCLDEINSSNVDIKKVPEYTRILIAGSNMLNNSTTWINEVLIKISSYQYLRKSGDRNSFSLYASLLKLKAELRSLIGPTICNTTVIHSAITKLNN